ncbi:MAG: Calcium-transporting ATPase [Chlamydiae bacterium]|nr:Calcium-transporting ATPase [Chlamydiota bacterium]
MQPWNNTPLELAKKLGSDLSRGLSTEEAAVKAKTYGSNALPMKGGEDWWKILIRQFSSLIIWLLIVAALVAGLLGEVVDAWAILAIVILNASLGFFQEHRAERALEALQKLSSPLSKVIREGTLREIPSKEIVPGDLVLLQAGDLVPADGRIVSSHHLTVEEASLTGESIPVGKKEERIEGDLLLADRRNMAFMGTSVAAGKGHLLVTEIGLESEIGQIASQLLAQKKEETPLQKKLESLGRKLVYICLCVVGIVFGLGVLRGTGLIEMLLISLSLAVAAIPEGLPAAVTIALSIGVRKMSEKKALVRRLSSVETLGSTTVICTDKTGTLTQNAMTVRSLWVDRQVIEVSGSGYSPEGEFPTNKTPSLEMALTIGVLCNNANLFQEDGSWKIAGDPTEGALIVAAAKGGIDKLELEQKRSLIEEFPFDSERKMMSVLREVDGEKVLYVKGAPDVIAKHSTKMLVDGEELEIDREEISRANDALASQAYRVLAVAYRKQVENIEEEELVFVGLMAMIDPPRPEVKEAIASCRSAGIRTIMVTGDHKETAMAIARELEILDGAPRALDGTQLDAMSDQELSDELEEIAVFSRISAAHKLRIIDALKKKGEVTAMTGDGVNDAPAVKAADIGVAMGITGTDVTKESSDMVILDDNFASIVRAVKQGRGIYDNIVKFVSYLLSSNIAEILVIFLTMLFGFKGPDGAPFVALLPVQLLWMNLVTDGFPAISLAMDPIDPRAMERPPRPPKEEILNPRFTLFLFVISLLVTSGAIIACLYGLRSSVALAQTMTFTTLVVLELVRVQMIRTQYRLKLFSNPYLIGALASSFLLQLLVLYVPSLRPIFGTVPLNLMQWGIIFSIAFFLWWLGLLVTKLFYKSRL